MVATAAKCGVDGIEASARAPHFDEHTDLRAVQRMGAAVREAGLGVLAYGSYLSYDGPDHESLVRTEVARAEALAAERMRVWAGHPAGASDENRADVVALMRDVADAAGAVGLDVVIERHEGSFADTVARCTQLLDAIDRPNVALNFQCLDDIRADDAKNVAAEARALIPRSRYLHVKNYSLPGDPTQPVVFGGDLRYGVLDYREILAAALEAGYRGPLTIEFLGIDARPLEEKLADGVAFLREILAECAERSSNAVARDPSRGRR